MTAMATLFGDLAETATLLEYGAERNVDSFFPDGLSNNGHIHLPPNFSAFTTPAQAVELAAEQGVQVLGATNYYNYTVYQTFASEAKARGVFPLFGLEIITLVDDLVQAGIKVNDPGNPGKFYICGKGITQFDPLSETAQELLDVIRTRDSERMALVTARLAEVFAQAGCDTGLAEAVVKEAHCPPSRLPDRNGVLARAPRRGSISGTDLRTRSAGGANRFTRTCFRRHAAFRTG